MKLVTFDDQPDIVELISAVGESQGWECASSTDLTSFDSSIIAGTDLVFLDLLMPGIDGVEMIRKLAQAQSRAGLVLISGLDRRVLQVAEDLARSLGLRTLGRLEKPFRIYQIEEFLERAKEVPLAKASLPGPDLLLPLHDVEIALTENRVIPFFQVQKDLKTGEFSGCEALVRILDPERGIVPPVAFLPAVEGSPLIRRLTERMMELTLRQYISAPGHWSLSLNLSPKMLDDLTLPDEMAAAVQAQGLEPSRIVIEVTESGLIQNPGIALDILSRLRIKGFRLSVDDYGTGYSSMGQLKIIPATELKIDRMFVMDVLRDPGCRTMVRTTIELAHSLNLVVVAEGIETKEQEELLRSLDCDLGQGYLYSQPVPFGELKAFR